MYNEMKFAVKVAIVDNVDDVTMLTTMTILKIFTTMISVSCGIVMGLIMLATANIITKT